MSTKLTPALSYQATRNNWSPYSHPRTQENSPKNLTMALPSWNSYSDKKATYHHTIRTALSNLKTTTVTTQIFCIFPIFCITTANWRAKLRKVRKIYIYIYQCLLMLYTINHTFILHILEITDWFIDTELLLNRHCPIIFESIVGVCRAEHNSTSSYNEEEITAVMSYVHNILLTETWNNRRVRCCDIGIISPYRSQCDRIRSKCDEKGCGEITIGSAEQFQGQEKPIIIISTVRTAEKGLGFLKNPQVRASSSILST